MVAVKKEKGSAPAGERAGSGNILNILLKCTSRPKQIVNPFNYRFISKG